MTSNLPFGLLWLTVLLMFGAVAVLFLLVRLPEEVDRVDDEVDDDFVVRACAGTPLEAASRRGGGRPGRSTRRTTPRWPASSAGT